MAWWWHGTRDAPEMRWVDSTDVADVAQMCRMLTQRNIQRHELAHILYIHIPNTYMHYGTAGGKLFFTVGAHMLPH